MSAEGFMAQNEEELHRLRSENSKMYAALLAIVAQLDSLPGELQPIEILIGEHVIKTLESLERSRGTQ